MRKVLDMKVAITGALVVLSLPVHTDKGDTPFGEGISLYTGALSFRLRQLLAVRR